MAGSTDTKIRFTVDGVNQLHQEFQKILTDSQSLTKEWEAQGTAIVQSLKEQLELLKTRNSLARPSSVPSTPTGGASTAIATSQGQSVEDIEQALESVVTDGLRLSSETLKELADMLKSTSTPTGGGAEGGGERPRPSTGGGAEGDGGESKEGTFIRTVGRFALNNVLNPVQSNDPARSLLGIGSNLGSAMMQSGNPYAMAGGAALSLISGIATARYGRVADIAPTGAEAARMFGGSWEEYSVRNRLYEEFGLGAKEALQRRIELARSMGRQNLGENLYESTLWEQTTSLGQQDILSLARSARGDERFGVDRNLSILIGNLTRSGISNEKIQTQMSEYLREIVNLNQTQVQQFGVANTGQNTALYNMIAKAFPKETSASPEFAGRIAGSLYRGLASPKTPQTQALRWEAIRQANPNASWFDVKMMMEDPLGTEASLTDRERRQRQRATQNYLNLLWKAGGDWGGRALLMQQEFDFSANVAGRLAKGDRLDFTQFMKELEKDKTSESKKKELENKVSATVDDISKLTSQWSGMMLGENVKSIKDAVEGIRKLLAGEEPAPDSALGATVVGINKEQSVKADMLFSGKGWKRVGGGLIAAAESMP